MPVVIGERLVEDYGFVSVAKNAALEMPADGAGEDDAFEVASAGDEVFDLVAVGDASYVLLNDGAVVKDGSDVVAGCANQFDSAGVGGMVRARADESRQERVMHVDDGGRVTGHEFWGENLHVAGEDDELDFEIGEQGQLAGFRIGARGRGHGDVFEADAVECGQLFSVAVVRDEDRDLAVEFSGTGAMQEVGNAMQVLGAENGDPIPVGLGTYAVELPAHFKFLSKGRKGGNKGCYGVVGWHSRIGFDGPLDAHEEEAEGVVLMLIGVKDVGALRIEQSGYTGDEALLVGAIDEQNGAFGTGLRAGLRVGLKAGFGHRFKLNRGRCFM